MEGLPAIFTQFSKSSPETCNEKELQLSLPVLTDTEDVFIGSLNVIAILVFFAIPVALSEGDEDEKDGAVVSTINVFTLNALLAFPAESVTVMVQL
jgi:hypothetical protein